MAPSLSVSYTWNTTGEAEESVRGTGASEGSEVRLTLNLLVSAVHCVLMALGGSPEPRQSPHKLPKVDPLHRHLRILPAHTHILTHTHGA